MEARSAPSCRSVEDEESEISNILTPTGPLALVSESRSPGDADVECWISHDGYQNIAQRPATRAGTEGQPDPAIAPPAAQAGTAHSCGKHTCGAGTHVPALFALLLVWPASAADPPVHWHVSTTTRAWLPSSTRRSECQCPASSTWRSEWQYTSSTRRSEWQYTSSTRRSASHQCPSSTRRSDYQFPSSMRRSEHSSSTRRSERQCPSASDAPRKR